MNTYTLVLILLLALAVYVVCRQPEKENLSPSDKITWEQIKQLWPVHVKHCGMNKILDLHDYETVKKHINKILDRVEMDMPPEDPWGPDHKHTKMLRKWRDQGMPEK